MNIKNLDFAKILNVMDQMGESKIKHYVSWNKGYRSDFTTFTIPTFYSVVVRPEGGKRYNKCKLSDVIVKFLRNEDGTFNLHQMMVRQKHETNYHTRQRIIKSFSEKLEGLFNANL